MIGLDTIIVILDNNVPLVLIDSNVKQENKKKEKAKKCWQRKINLAQATFSAAGGASSAPLSPVAGNGSLFIVDVVALLYLFASGSSSSVAAGGFLSAVFSVDASSSSITNDLLSSITAGGSLSLIADYSLFIVFGNPLSFIAIDSHLSTISSIGSLSTVAGSCLLFHVASDDYFSPLTSGLLSLITSSSLLFPASFLALSLPDTSSHTHHFSLSS